MADKKDKVPASTPAERWRSGRNRFRFLQFQRGRDKKWSFSGQQPGEEVTMVVRRHWWFLMEHAWLFLTSVVAFVAIVWASWSMPGDARVWPFLDAAAFLTVLGLGGWFAYKHLAAWWFDCYIITNKRIINIRGLFQPTRQEIPIDKVQQVSLGVETFLGFLLRFATVHVYLAGGDLLMKEVPHPKKVKDALQGITDTIKAKKGKEVPAPPLVPKNPDLAGILDELAKGKPLPKLPDADENLPPLRNQDRFRGPRRTFVGILHIPCDVRYVSGEYTVKYIQRSQYVLWRREAVPALLLLLVLPLSIFIPVAGYVPGPILQYWWFLMGFILLGLLATHGADLYGLC